MLDEKNVFLNVEIDTKTDALKFLAKKAVENGIAKNEKGVLKDLLAREEEYSTGVQDGFAIPHAKSSNVIEPSIFYIKTKNELEWETLDGSNVKYIFSLMVPEENENNVHLMMLSKLATCLMEDDFKKEIISSEDKSSLIKYISKKWRRNKNENCSSYIMPSRISPYTNGGKGIN
ncbi:PTS sugar transporter subunit IIA [Clostridium beijerinckii]|uniref:PTS sugar transporter subunit IIA n=1 Tax=Clostridium beijerinckii TaxID=1520 RepID=UPI0015700AAB|nr:PTS sugar transporter subunit IIA [Clostridium beijerinckii]NSA90886.1 PTS system fructose-specific IIA component [Clostridium beijerinckii]